MGAQGLSYLPTLASSLAGEGKGEACGTEADVPPPALQQPLPIPAPTPASLPHLPAPTPSTVPGLFQPPVLAPLPPPVQPELLPPRPAPAYSDAVRNLPDQGSEEPVAYQCHQQRLTSSPTSVCRSLP